jgi:hypothetical protein
MATNKSSNILTSIHGKRLGINAEGQLVLDGNLITNPTDPLWAGAPGGGSPYSYYEVFEDFMYPASATASDLTAWTLTNDGATGTNAFQDAVGGIFNLVTAASDNDHNALSLQHETFKFAAGKRLWLEARVKLAEANTNTASWWVGLTDTLTTGGLQADAAGPLASYDGALIYKAEAMVLNFESSNAGTQVTSAAEVTSVTDTWNRVGFFFDGGNSSSATSATLTPFYAVNGSNTFVKGAAQTITLSGLEEMHLVIGVKAGSANAETLQIDYVKCVAER